jgi:hypothetical protein
MSMTTPLSSPLNPDEPPAEARAVFFADDTNVENADNAAADNTPAPGPPGYADLPTLTNEHAAISFHNKHVLPNLESRQKQTLDTLTGAIKDKNFGEGGNWLSELSSSLPDYHSLSVHASTALSEAEHLVSRGILPMHATVGLAAKGLYENLPRMVRVAPGMPMVRASEASARRTSAPTISFFCASGAGWR